MLLKRKITGLVLGVKNGGGKNTRGVDTKQALKSIGREEEKGKRKGERPHFPIMVFFLLERGREEQDLGLIVVRKKRCKRRKIKLKVRMGRRSRREDTF